MPFRAGKVMHEDGGISVARCLERREDGSCVFAGFSLVGSDIDPSFRYDTLEDAKRVIERLLGRSVVE
jgi:hypothetical protein